MMNEFIFENIKDFNPKETFECGQCFRWEAMPGGSYMGIAGSFPAHISYSEGTINIKSGGGDRDFWENYLDLGRDYSAIKRYLAGRDSLIKKAIASGEGIRILRQEPWETIVSFIISANNNIPRIKGCIENLAKGFGEPCGEFEGRAFYSLPSPKTLASLTAEDLAPVRLGYRADYLVKTAKKVATCCEQLPPLCELTGVGPKVESCIRLFGLGQMDSFPVDVWVKRVMHELYGFDEKDVKGMKAFAAEKFGPYGGIAQQYLFYYMRELGKNN